MSPKKILSSNEINFYKKYGYLVKKELISENIINKVNQKIKNLILFFMLSVRELGSILKNL